MAVVSCFLLEFGFSEIMKELYNDFTPVIIAENHKMG